MKGKLYLVATPIGNLEDITLRAIRILKEVDLIAAEDTRHTLKLLNHLEISKPMISCYRHNEDVKSNLIIEKLKQGNNIAIVSDAGTPGISDPGGEVVKCAINEDIKIIPIPGACAAINALIASGIDTNEFIFLGFLPLNKKLRKIKLEEIKSAKNTIILYEAPHKILNTIKDLKNILENRQVVLAKEITKIYEEYIRGNINEIEEKLKNPKGEFVIIIEGLKNVDNNENKLNLLTLDKHYEFYLKKGYEKKEIIKLIAKDRNVNKNEIYKKFITKK